MTITPVTLTGKSVRLEPPTEKHIADLVVAAQPDEIWEYLAFGPYKTADEWRAIFRRWQEATEQGRSLSFAIIPLGVGRAVGMTAYLDIQPHNRSVELAGHGSIRPSGERRSTPNVSI